MNLDFSPEFTFLLACLNARMSHQLGDTKQLQTIQEALQAPVTAPFQARLPAFYQVAIPVPLDWDHFSQLVLRHKVAALVLPILSSLGTQNLIPNHVCSLLKMHSITNSCYVLDMVVAIKTLLALLAEKGIVSLVLKGPPLSQQLYGQLAIREPRDLDLLIDPKHLQNVHTLLLEIGYRCCVPITATLSPKQFNFYQKQKKSFVYYHEHSQQQLELHWRLFDDARLFAFDLEENHDSRRFIEASGINIPTLSWEDNLLYLLLHGSHHAWSQLSWLCDIATLVRSSQTCDWEQLASRAQTLNIELQIAEGLLLAHHLLQAPLPAPVKRILQHHKVVGRLAHYSLRVMQDVIYLTRGARITMLLREIRLHIALRSYFQPFKQMLDVVAADWEVVRLPDKLFFLYYLLRPGLWVWRKVSKCWHKRSINASN